MKKTFLSICLLATVTIGVFSSCKKDKDDPNQEIEITTANMIGSYKLTAETDKLGTLPERNTLAEDYDACELDDLYQFEAANVVKYVDAGTKCEEDHSGTVTWKLEGKKLTIDDRNFDVVKLTKSQIIFTFTRETVFEGKTYTGVQTSTFTRQ